MSNTDVLRIKKKYNCPNCAAPITDPYKCSYCGTLLDWIPVNKIEVITSPVKLVNLETATELPSWMYGDSDALPDTMVLNEIQRNFGQEIMKYVTVSKQLSYTGNIVCKGRLIIGESVNTKDRSDRI